MNGVTLMLDDFEQIAREAWDKRSPLEEMYEHWLGEGRWEPARPGATYRIYSNQDIEWRGHFVLAGHPFPCHLCGSTDRWVPEGDEVRQIVRVFVCEHEPVHIVRGGVRRISSVPVRLVASAEETSDYPD